jgi:hypothetical protein
MRISAFGGGILIVYRILGRALMLDINAPDERLQSGYIYGF